MARTSILRKPMQPGVFRVCPNCRRWFALRFVAGRPDEKQRRISVYRCSKCNKTVEFAASHPPGTV